MTQRKTPSLAFTRFLFALLLLPLNTSSAQNPPLPLPDASETPPAVGKVESCDIQGTVVAAGGEEPLRGARLVLNPIGEAAPRTFSEAGPRADATFASTDGDGHFLIKGVPPGRYHFQASKNGFVPQAYRPDGSEGSETVLDLAAGQKLEKVQFKLRRAAVILGRITDENGEPVVGVLVEALISQGRLEGLELPALRGQWIPLKSVSTNDLGEYRIFGLPPGSYYVAAIDSGLGELVASMGSIRMTGTYTAFSGDVIAGVHGDPSAPHHAAVYYPGVSQRSQAQRVRLSAGQEMRIDISLLSQKTVTVSGHVLGPNGKPAPQTVIILRSQNLESMSSALGTMGSTDAQGSFEIKGVAPGSYFASATGALEGKSLSAEQPLEVAAEDVTGLRLQLSGGLEISGKLIVPSGSQIDLSEAQILLSPAQGLQQFGFASIKEDRTFTTSELHQGTYSLLVNGLPEGWYVSRADFGGENILENGLRVGEANAAHALEVTIKSGMGKVEGVVLKDDNPVTGAVVRLLPERPSVYRLGMERTAATDQRGHFFIPDVVPGSYRALAAAHDENDNDDDSDDAAAGASSTTMAVKEGESKTVQLKLKTREP